jgi:hypothetical protein
MKSVCIITTKISNDFQVVLLNNSVKGVQKNNPETDIVILNDFSNPELLPKYEGVRVIDIEESHRGCGEVNAYVWACKNYKEYDTFVFLHDSAIVFNRIPLEMPNETTLFRTFWFSEQFINSDIYSDESAIIRTRFNLNIGRGWGQIAQGGGNGNMVFGGMGIFTQEFARRLSETNFLELAPIFNKRHVRSFFERFLFCIVDAFQDTKEYRKQSLCGCIFHHGYSFRNTAINGNVAHNPYVVKCWQGR